MAIAIDVANLGETAADSAGTTVAFTTTSAVAAGGFIVLGVTCIQPQTLSSVSGGGLTWTIDKQGTASSSMQVAVVSAQAPSGLASGTTITATFSASTGGGRSICGTSFTGVATSTPVDGTPDLKGNATTTAWTSNGVTVLSGSVLVTYCSNSSSLQTSTPTSPTLELHDFGNGGFSSTMGYQIAASGGAKTNAGTWSGTVNSTAVSVGYLAAAASGVTVTAVPMTVTAAFGPNLAISPTIVVAPMAATVDAPAPTLTAVAAIAPFYLFGHTGTDRLWNIEGWLVANTTGFTVLPTYNGTDRLWNIESYLQANPVNSVTFTLGNGTDRIWNIESYLLTATSSSG